MTIFSNKNQKQQKQDRLAAGLAFGIPLGLAGSVYFLNAAAGLSWRYGGEDGGDLALATLLLGVPHPTGYPLYLLTGRLFLFLAPEVNPVRVLNLASACWGTLATGLIGLTVFKLARTSLREEKSNSPEQVRKAAVIGGVLAGLSLAFAPLVWSQALIVEVYSFNLLLMGLLLLTMLDWWEAQNEGKLALVALVAGLALSHHHTALFSLAGVLLFGLLVVRERIQLARNRSTRFGVIGKMVLLFLTATVIPYLYLPMRGGVTPVSNWGDATLSNPLGLWEQFSGSEYHYLLFAAPLSQSLGRISAGARLLVEQFGLVGLGLGWTGLVAAWLMPRVRPFFWLVFVMSSFHLGFTAIYAAENSQVYLIPLFALWAMLLGWGTAWIITRPWISLALKWAVIVLALLLIPALNLLTHYSRLDLSHDQSAEEWAKWQLQIAPPHALLISYTDQTTFALWYVVNERSLKGQSGFQPDYVVIDARLLGKEWYRRNLIRCYSGLKLELEGVATPSDQIASLATANPERPLVIVTLPSDYAERSLP
ncbi:MAG: DUF2723 domain-containing protein [Chloroflexota bacterium]